MRVFVVRPMRYQLIQFPLLLSDRVPGTVWRQAQVRGLLLFRSRFDLSPCVENGQTVQVRYLRDK